MRNKTLRALVLSAAVAAVPGAGRAMTPQELRDLLDRREAVTVIDVRGAADFGESHIPGALNLPAEVLPGRRLPPLGRVAVCGDGIAAGVTRAAVRALNAKPGVRAEPLEGGLDGWEALGLPTTRARGAGAEKLRYLSFQELAAAATNPDVLLVDLRTGPPPLADLAAKFPGVESVRMVRGGAASDGALIGRDPPGRRLYVLIDDGGGESERLAQRLRAAGVRRVAVLAGGERTLVRDGQPGRATRESRGTP